MSNASSKPYQNPVIMDCNTLERMGCIEKIIIKSDSHIAGVEKQARLTEELNGRLVIILSANAIKFDGGC